MVHCQFFTINCKFSTVHTSSLSYNISFSFSIFCPCLYKVSIPLSNIIFHCLISAFRFRCLMSLFHRPRSFFNCPNSVVLVPMSLFHYEMFHRPYISFPVFKVNLHLDEKVAWCCLSPIPVNF